MNSIGIKTTSREWALLKEHILNRIEESQLSIEVSADPTAIYRLQGRIQSLRQLILDVEPDRPVSAIDPGTTGNIYT